MLSTIDLILWFDTSLLFITFLKNWQILMVNDVNVVLLQVLYIIYFCVCVDFMGIL